MTVASLLDTLRQLGVSVQPDGANLRVRPWIALSDELRTEIREHKPELLELLASGSDLLSISPAEDSVKALKPELHKPAMQELLDAARARAVAPGLVDVDSALVRLWRAAEVEVGYPLTLSGNSR